MTTSKYLDSVLQVMPATQAKQISDLLTDLKNAGEIRNAEEYNSKLEELSTLINDSEPVPLFKQIPAGIWFSCSSDQHNYMMEYAKNDLNSLYEQIDEIGSKIEDHHFLVMKTLVHDLEKGLADQENKIIELEWLEDPNNEFSYALVNSFKSATLQRIARSELEASSLYFDNRTYIDKTEEELPSAIIDEYGEKLILNELNQSLSYPISVRQLNDENSYGTEENVQTQNNINNILDGKSGTFWLRDVYLSSKVPKVSTVLEFDLGTAKDVTYISIEGATSLPFFIDSIYGITPQNNEILISDTEVEVSGNIRIDFDRVFIKAFKINFSVSSYNKKEYFVEPESSNIYDVIEPNKPYIGTNLTSSVTKTVASNKPKKVIQSNLLGSAVSSVINSNPLSNILNIPKDNTRQINSYVYSFGLDNVWTGNSRYYDSSIFVSKPLKLEDIGVLSVDSKDNILSTGIDNSIEFEIVKRDNPPFFKESKFPIPIINQSTVNSERLILTKKEDTNDIEDSGKLRFCPYLEPDFDIAAGPPVRIFQDDKELIFGDDYSYAINTFKTATGTSLNWESSSWLLAADFTNYKLSVPKMWIKIHRPVSNAVYTVNYTIRTSDSYVNDNTLWLDIDKTIYLGSEGRVYFRRDDLDVTINSEIYLQVTLRRNLPFESKSPELFEYSVLASKYTT